jgi:glycosyltransferase involved in cell wall biosynthesis
MEEMIDVSVILCAYNEADVIEDAIENVDSVMMKSGWNYEIVVVDDGSVDDTKKRALDCRDKKNNARLKIVGYKKNAGKGAALKTGFAHAGGKFVVAIDSDLDVDPYLIPNYVEALKTNDIAVASKWNPKSRTVMASKRKVLSFGFNALSRLLTGIKLRDTQTGLKAFRRTVFERMAPKFLVERYAFDLEMMSACNHAGFKIVELPVNIHVESMIGFREIFRMSADMFKVAYRLRVKKYYQRP